MSMANVVEQSMLDALAADLPSAWLLQACACDNCHVRKFLMGGQTMRQVWKGRQF